MTTTNLTTTNQTTTGTGQALPPVLSAPAIVPIESAQNVLSGQVAIQATPATPSTITTASFQKESPANLYSFSKKVRWGGENYVLKLDFPCKDWKKIPIDQLKQAASDYADYFVADLRKTLEAEKGDKRIQPGDDFEILFQEEGYTAFIPANGFNPLTDDVTTLDKFVQTTSEQSKTLSQIIEKIPEQNSSYPQTILTSLSTEKSLTTLREEIKKQKVATAIARDPINMKPHNNGCFINAAFQVLANDPNEEVFRALRNPDNYANGEETPLYKAVIAYDESQRLGSRCDISKILTIPNKEQADAVLDALEKFEGYLSKNADECLKTALKIPVSAIDETSLEAIASKRFKDCKTLKDLPNDFSIYTPRIIQPNTLTLAIISKFIIPELDGLGVAFDSTNDSDAEVDEIDQKIAEEIYKDSELYDKIFKKLPLETQQQINEARAANLKLTKNETPISIDSQGIVKVTVQDDSEKTYDLMSFIAHTGTDGNGHYVTYLQKGGKYWCLDDQKTSAQSISLEKFVKAAQGSGCYYQFKEQPLPSSSDSSNPEDKEIKAKSNLIVAEPQKIANTATYYSEEEGKMEMKDFLLVNPSNKNLFDIHSQISEVADEKTLQKDIRIAAATAPHWRTLGKPIFEPRTGNKWYNFAPGTLLTISEKQSILHIALNPLNNAEDVKQATKDILESAMENGKTQVALPVFEYSGKEDDVVPLMKEAISSFVAKHPTEWRTGHIKIVRPSKITQKDQEAFTDSEIDLPKLGDENESDITTVITPEKISSEETSNDDDGETGSVVETNDDFTEIDLGLNDDEDYSPNNDGSARIYPGSDDDESSSQISSNDDQKIEEIDD